MGNEIKSRFEVIELESVDVVRNVRTQVGDVAGLMTSIAKQGLLHPIGVYEPIDGKYILRYGHRRLEACRKLGWHKIPAMITNKEYVEDDKDFLLENFSENKNRSETTPIEDGKLFLELALPVSEIASETGIKEKYIKESIEAFKRTPEKYKPDVGIIVKDKYQREKPTIEIKKANMITSAELPMEETEQLFEWAKSNSSANLRLVVTALTRASNRPTVDKAIEDISNMTVFRLFFVVPKSKREALVKKYHKPFGSIIIDIINGKLPAEKGLIPR